MARNDFKTDLEIITERAARPVADELRRQAGLPKMDDDQFATWWKLEGRRLVRLANVALAALRPGDAVGPGRKYIVAERPKDE